MAMFRPPFLVIFLEHKYPAYNFITYGRLNFPSEPTMDEFLEKAADFLIRTELGPLDSKTQLMLKVHIPIEPIDATGLVSASRADNKRKYRFDEDSFDDKVSTCVDRKSLQCAPEVIIVDYKLVGPRRTAGIIAEHEGTDKYTNRDIIAKAAQERSSPTVGAKLDSLQATQVSSRPDAIYNCHPLTLQPPPINIYHPVFANHEELDNAFSFINTSLRFYTDAETRQSSVLGLEFVAPDILTQRKIFLKSGSVAPDGVSYSSCPVFTDRKRRAIKAFTYVKSEIGTGGCDPAPQAECAYIAVYSSDEYAALRQVSCCPAFLIGMPGPFITVSGAVFADNFISERLTDYMFIGPKPSLEDRSSLDEGIRRIAQLLRTLKTCFEDLDLYYSTLQPLSKAPLSFFPPHFTEYHSGGILFTLTYTQRLDPSYPEKAIFKATARSGSETKTVVVKFTNRYGAEGHGLLAAAKPQPLAPELFFCEKVESVGMYVVVIEFVQGLPVQLPVDATGISTVWRAIEMLHKKDLVFGDLRDPNLLRTDRGVMLIDFDWCGKIGEACYPSDIFLDGDIKWHPEVRRGGEIRKKHDMYMLSCLEDSPN